MRLSNKQPHRTEVQSKTRKRRLATEEQRCSNQVPGGSSAGNNGAMSERIDPDVIKLFLEASFCEIFGVEILCMTRGLFLEHTFLWFYDTRGTAAAV